MTEIERKQRVAWKAIVTHFIPFLAALACAPIIVWAMESTPPVVYYDLKPINDKVHPGGEMTIEVTAVRSALCEDTKVYQTIIDSEGKRHTIPERISVVPNDRIGQRIIGYATFFVPVVAAPGPAKYLATVEYHCNPWQRYVRPLQHDEPPIDFTILEGVQPSAARDDWFDHMRTVWSAVSAGEIGTDPDAESRSGREGDESSHNVRDDALAHGDGSSVGERSSINLDPGDRHVHSRNHTAGDPADPVVRRLPRSVGLRLWSWAQRDQHPGSSADRGDRPAFDGQALDQRLSVPPPDLGLQAADDPDLARR